jgi:hypothetical protein
MPAIVARRGHRLDKPGDSAETRPGSPGALVELG